MNRSTRARAKRRRREREREIQISRCCCCGFDEFVKNGERERKTL